MTIASESSTKRERITDDKNCYVMTNYVRIAGNPTSFIYNHIKHIDLLKATKYRSFNKRSAKRKGIFECVDGIKW